MLVYVPNYIICSPVFPPKDQVLIQNPIPHVTQMQGIWPAVNSNYVQEALFTSGGPMQQLYESGQLNNDSFSYQHLFPKMEIYDPNQNITWFADVFVVKHQITRPGTFFDYIAVNTKNY